LISVSTLSFFHNVVKLYSKVIAEVTFQTRINVAEVEVAQPVPLQALGPKPMTLSHINFGVDADPNAQPPQSFLRQYVSLSSLRFLSINHV
jgi:hypothetical protein